MSFLETNFVAAAAKKPITELRVAIDVGSTQTRSCIFTATSMDDPIILDSNYEIINRSIDRISSPGSAVLSNLDMIITDLTADKKVNPVFTELHVLKGEMLSAITTSRRITASSASKIDQDATYINIICNVALQHIYNFTKNGISKETIPTYLAVTLPPEDTKFQQRIELFTQRIVGTYEVKFPRLDVSVKFSICDDLTIKSEPEAVAVYQSVEGALDDEGESVVCVLDIGGRSTGITFIDDRHLREDSCFTAPLGGSNLLSILAREISSAYNIQEPTTDRLIKALSTGTFKLGAQKLDISTQLNDAKAEFANLIFNELVRAVDINRIQMQSISRVFCSGRTFGEAPNSPSLMEILMKMFQTKSEYTEFSRITADNPILTGITYLGVAHAAD